ncbi:Imidazolonepropionase [Desulfamplus magnetovallimortis]|uniref:Imidazolonepropionase n=1 Tax=Desulfamplus magnetovallimortis TaxID=1246637 RepID=A0A1W1HBK4_9BACT|nr:imidazolonepropionase [Desulfamplus magnetovallimortis]SLM29816.1 Imidazolonepropionase [Desulfamplus magnetovallimortis]
MIRKLFKNANIYTPVDYGRPAAGEAQTVLNHFPHGAIIVEDGLIKAVGNEPELFAGVEKSCAGSCDVHMEIDCAGKCLIPGFVDPHTHMCFAERREGEFEMRIGGTPYLEILGKGGGILSSVRAVADSGEEKLYAVTLKNVLSALKFGTTTVEIKSGYGLDTQNELKMLNVIDKVARTTPLDVVATFLGAHAVPPEYRNDKDGFIDLVIREMLPAVKAQGVAMFCDIFCEKGVFTIEQGRRLLKAARKLGFGTKIHADEVHDLGGAALAAEISSISADHLLAASDENMEKMAAAGVVATLLPATAYSLRKPYARARKMIETNLPVALATDCNPGSSFTESMPFIIGLAVLNMEMTPAEALTAATLNSAYAIDMASRVGSLDVGKQADFLLLDGKSPAVLAYHAGVSPVSSVYKLGEKIV